MLCFVFAALIVILDQFIKRWVMLTIVMHESKPLIPGIIGLTYERNTGAAFSILADQRWLLIGIAFLAALLLIAILLRYNDGFWGTLGLSAVLGGTVGNLIDRITQGPVVDMFELQFMNFAIFNIADIFITLGGITFLIYFIITTIRPQKKHAPVYEEAPVDYSAAETPQVEDQIGLYDFQYGEEPSNRDTPEYDSYSGGRPVSGQYSESEQHLSGYYNDPELNVGAFDRPDARESTLDALSALEMELQETGAIEDYDLDELLREYGFEDDADQV